MKTFFKVCVILLLLAILSAYIAFLFVLPKMVDLNIYKPEIQKLVKEYSKLDLNFDNISLTTAPNLSAGAILNNISIKFPDGSELFSANSAKARISLPKLLLLTVNVTCAEVQSPSINLEIANGKEFKIVKLIDDILTAQEQKILEDTPPAEPPIIEPSMIKIKAPSIKITDYNLVMNDLKSGHSLILEGDSLLAGYFGKTFKVKTEAKLLSDNKVNIATNIDINSFIPTPTTLDKDDDPAVRAELPFVNPVLLYRDYNVKSDINAKLKIRQKKDLIKLNGFLNVENATLNLSGYQLPNCFFRSKFRGTKAFVDTNFFVTPKQHIELSGMINYGKKPSLDIIIASDKIQIQDLLVLSKAVLDTLQVPNSFNELKGKGYIEANACIKTNFKKLKSNGNIIAREGNISNNKLGLVISGINANLLLDGDMLNIQDTHAMINGTPLNAEGKIDKNSVVDIIISLKGLSVSKFFNAFAPIDLKKSYTINSGTFSFDSKIAGKLKTAISKTNIELKNFSITEKTSNIKLDDEWAKIILSTEQQKLNGKIENKNLKINIPSSNSIIFNPAVVINIVDNTTVIEPAKININNSSTIEVSGKIEPLKNSIINKNLQIAEIKGNGKLFAEDLKKLAGKEAATFLRAEGVIPLEVNFTGDKRRQYLTVKMFADADNYITPIDIQTLVGKPSILQLNVDLKGDRLRIKETGLYTNPPISSDLDKKQANSELQNTKKEIMGISGTITDLNSEPFINLMRISIPQNINGTLCGFKNSAFNAGGKVILFGKAASPRIRGNFTVKDAYISDLYLTLKEAVFGFHGKELAVDLNKLILNGSDLDISLTADLNPSPVFTITNLNLISNNLNLDKLLKVSDAAVKYTPPAPKSTQPADIPLAIRNGNIDIKRFSTGNIIAQNTTGKISLKNNVFFLNNLNTTAFNGNIRGNVSSNLITSAIRSRVNGYSMNVERALLAAAGMKETLNGTINFRADLSLRGTTQLEQMKTLKGNFDFRIRNGQFGPFGKLENLILAENIRESQFFQTALGGVINSIATIDTTHFSELNGNLTFSDGIAKIKTINSNGEVMSLHIVGDMNLLKNTADMKVQAKLASQISNMLGPIAEINPINLIQATPGLNVTMAKMFSIFCEQISAEEMQALPSFSGNRTENNASKFQLVLRGDVAKPLTLIKSFKWLASAEEINKAQAFINTLPEPVTEDEGTPAIQTIEEIEKYNAKPSTIIKNFFKRDKATNEQPETTVEQSTTEEHQTEEKNEQ